MFSVRPLLTLKRPVARAPVAGALAKAEEPYNASAEKTQTLTDVARWREDSKEADGSARLDGITPSLISSRIFPKR
jgi:hypothetical protein